MYVYWKTLLVLGVTLWIVLCITDILYEDYGSKKYLTSGEIKGVIVTETYVMFLQTNRIGCAMCLKKN